MKQVLFCLLAISLLFIWACNGNVEPPKSTTTQPEPPKSTVAPIVSAEWQKITAKDITFEYKVEGANLSVKLTGPASGWLAVGFDPSDGMQDANIIMGYVKDGQGFFRDDFGTGRGSHQPDTELGGVDNIIDKSGKEENNITELSFKIPLNSGDAKDKELEVGKTYEVMLAQGKADDFTSFHIFKTEVKVTIK